MPRPSAFTTKPVPRKSKDVRDDRLPLAAAAGETEPSPVDGRAVTKGMTIAFFGLIVVGIVILRLPGATTRGNELSFERAVFTTVNAITLAGFQQSTPLDQLGPTGKSCVLTLTAYGTLYALIVGGIGVARLLRLPYSDGRIIFAALYAYVFFICCGAAIIAQPGRGLLASATQSASAFGHSGLFLGRLPTAADWRTHAALMPLVFLGGLSIPVLLELVDLVFHRRPLSRHARVVLAFSAGVYLIGLMLLTPWPKMLAPAARGADAVAALATGSALAIDARSAGLPVATIASMTRWSQWVLIALMLLGPAPGSAGGGLKITALYHAFRGTRRALGREPGLRITGIAAAHTAAHLALVFAVLLLLLATLPELPGDRIAFLAASSVGLVGLSHDPISLTGPGLYVLSLATLLGRFLPLVVLWWAVRTTDDADVAVG